MTFLLITVKVVSKEDELEKRLVKEKEVKVEVVDKEPVPIVKKVKKDKASLPAPVLRTSSRLAVKRDNN